MKNDIMALKAHISLDVADIERSVEFYKNFSASNRSKIRQDYAKFEVRNPPLNLALNQSTIGGHGTLSHLGIQVGSTEDVLETKKSWEESGLITTDEMQTNCCYALQDKTWVRDPDGNEWEVFVVLEDNLPETNMCCINIEAETISENKPKVSATNCCVPALTLIETNQETQSSC